MKIPLLIYAYQCLISAQLYMYSTSYNTRTIYGRPYTGRMVTVHIWAVQFDLGFGIVQYADTIFHYTISRHSQYSLLSPASKTVASAVHEQQLLYRESAVAFPVKKMHRAVVQTFTLSVT